MKYEVITTKPVTIPI